MNYFKKSLDKFRQDALSKLFYDLLKRLLIWILAFAATTFFPDKSLIGEFLTKKVDLSIYGIILIGLGVILFTVLIVSILFNRKFQASAVVGVCPPTTRV